MKRFELDEEQVDAILELKLYRLARLEILMIQEELAEKRKEAKHLEGAAQVRRQALGRGQGRARRSWPRSTATSARPRSASRPTSRSSIPNAYIVDEDANVVLTRDGWVKRVRELKDASSTRTREGDAVIAGAGRQHQERRRLLHQLRLGVRGQIVDIPASTGYGDPVQKLFKFKDGERVVSARCRWIARVKPAEENLPRRLEERLRAALRARAAHRGVDARRPPLRQGRRGRRDCRRQAGGRGRRLVVASSIARISCATSARSTSWPTRAAASP